MVPSLGFEPRELLLLREMTLPICPRGHKSLYGQGGWNRTSTSKIQASSTTTILHPDYLASPHGLEPRPRVLETRMLPLHYGDINFGGPSGSRTPYSYVQGRCVPKYTNSPKFGGEYRIRTYESFPIFCLANRRNKPLCQFTILNHTGMS